MKADGRVTGNVFPPNIFI